MDCMDAFSGIQSGSPIISAGAAFAAADAPQSVAERLDERLSVFGLELERGGDEDINERVADPRRARRRVFEVGYSATRAG